MILEILLTYFFSFSNEVILIYEGNNIRISAIIFSPARMESKLPKGEHLGVIIENINDEAYNFIIQNSFNYNFGISHVRTSCM